MREIHYQEEKLSVIIERFAKAFELPEGTQCIEWFVDQGKDAVVSKFTIKDKDK